MNQPNSNKNKLADNGPWLESGQVELPAEQHFYQVLRRQLELAKPFAIATVVAVHGSASACLASKAIISGDKNIAGWVGGGCAESFVIQNAQQAIEIGEPRTVNVDLNDEVFGVGMACGGNIDVFIEPVIPKRISIRGESETAHWMRKWAKKCGYHVVLADPNHDIPADRVVNGDRNEVDCNPVDDHFDELAILTRTPAERAISQISKIVSLATNSDAKPKSIVEFDISRTSSFSTSCGGIVDLVVVGQSRITEYLAELAGSLDWRISIVSTRANSGNYAPEVQRIVDDEALEFETVSKDSYVLIATQHQGDFRIMRSVLSREPVYVGLISSRKRAALVLDALAGEGILKNVGNILHAPCGFDLGARSPFEIALSIICEIINHNNTPVK